MQRPVACYREFAPCKALREHVRAFFSFVPPAARNPAHRPIVREVVFDEGRLVLLATVRGWARFDGFRLRDGVSRGWRMVCQSWGTSRKGDRGHERGWLGFRRALS